MRLTEPERCHLYSVRTLVRTAHRESGVWGAELATLDRLLSAAETVELGTEYIARAPGECFETGRRYKVVAVYDGRMDLECAALDTTVAGVRIDDSALERVENK